MENRSEALILHPEDKWQSPEEQGLDQANQKLTTGIMKANGAVIKEVLGDVAIARALLSDRRNENINLLNLQKAVDFLLAEKFGEKANLYTINSEEIIKWLQAETLPEAVLNNDLASSYHLKNDQRFFRVLTILSEGQPLLKDKSTFPQALHNLATWETTINKNHKKGLEYNQLTVQGAREAGDIVLETKARVGITSNKDLKPKNSKDDYLKYIDIFNDNGDSLDAARISVEAARAFLSLARGQWGDSARLKIQNLGKAERFAQDALAEGLKLKYSNTIYQANLLLSEIYRELGKTNDAEKHLKLAKECEKDIK